MSDWWKKCVRVFAELKKKKARQLDLSPSTGEVEVKGRLEVAVNLFRKQVGIVLQRQKRRHGWLN